MSRGLCKDCTSDEFHKDNSVVDSMIPFLLQDPFTSAAASSGESGSSSSSSGVSTNNHNNNYHLIELPTCPVCVWKEWTPR